VVPSTGARTVGCTMPSFSTSLGCLCATLMNAKPTSQIVGGEDHGGCTACCALTRLCEWEGVVFKSEKKSMQGKVCYCNSLCGYQVSLCLP